MNGDHWLSKRRDAGLLLLKYFTTLPYFFCFECLIVVVFAVFTCQREHLKCKRNLRITQRSRIMCFLQEDRFYGFKRQ